jgi:alpha-beta hydrolase superfamily lysophospholipase
MATPTLTKHTLPGTLGEILIDVRAGGRASSRPAVVVVPGFKGFKDWGMFPPFAERLARAGLSAVSMNLSGSGVDDRGEFTLVERFGHNTYSAELDDLLRVVAALAGGELGVAPPTSIGLVGHSRGGGIGVLAAGEDRRIGALVTWAAISSVARWSPAEQRAWREAGMKEIVNTRTGQRLPLYPDILDDIERHALQRLDILGGAARLAIPWLILHGTADEAVSALEAEALHAAGREVGARHVPVDGAGHTFGTVHPWQGETPHFRLVADETLGFLAAHLA